MVGNHTFLLVEKPPSVEFMLDSGTATLVKVGDSGMRPRIFRHQLLILHTSIVPGTNSVIDYSFCFSALKFNNKELKAIGNEIGQPLGPKR